MALFSLSLNQVIICVIILSGLQPSLQQGFCENVFTFDQPIPEGPDTKGHVLYRANLTELSLINNDTGYLAVNHTQGNEFILFIAKEVDYEQKESIGGRIQCGVNQNSAEYDVFVPIAGVNEFTPEFDGQLPYVANISEDSSRGASVFSVSATDKDTNQQGTVLIYSIVTNTSLFTINGPTVSLNGPLDYDGGPTSYILNISVREQRSRNTSYTTLTINITDVDDVGPRFSSNATYTLSVPEGIYGASHASFATDPPMSAKDGDSLDETVKIVLDQTSSSLADRFRVEENGSIELTGTLAPGQYTINVRAYQTDRPVDRFAIASVLVTVYDVNDNSPVMSSPTYSGSVLEGAVPGTVVLTVSASDLDQGDNSSFAFGLNDTSVPFNITTDRSVGIIRVTGVIDRETTQSYTLQVFAKEDKTPESRQSNVSIVTITVLDANDNSPEFQGAPYTFRVNETDAVNYVVGQVNATDRDEGANGNVTYSISRTVGVVSAFRVDQSTGVITLSRGLRQNDTGTVLIDVKAEDNPVGGQSKRSASTQVTVTILPVNADRPAFSRSSYEFTVPETVPTNFSLGEISATDNDGDQLRYTLEGNSSAFRLEGNPPRLLIQKSLDLDNRQPNRYAFQVEVTDGLHPDTVNVTVSVTLVNEHSPVLAQSIYRADVWENATLGMLVVKIDATDDDAGKDGQVSFTMTTRDNGPFVLDSSGDLTLNCSGCLDVSARGSYILVVKAEDGGNPAQSNYTTVIITVKDVNNKAPKFASDVITGSVSENAGNGTTVLQLQARDEDMDTSPLTYSLENVTPAGWLAVTGSYVVTRGTLDAETSRFITATVKVSDGVQEGSASLNVTILDVNDNFPQILPYGAKVEVSENTTIGSFVLNVSATDADVTQSGAFLFFLGSPASGKFAINSSTGEVTVAAPFDRRIQKDYALTVSVSDNQAPPKMNSTVVHVTITDSNSAPEFVDSSNGTVMSGYEFTVSEMKDVGFVFGHVKAVDPDSGSSGDVRYLIQSGNDQEKFALNADNGALSLQKKLDFEEKTSYRLIVNATDNSYEPQWDTATVEILVEDVVEAPQWPSLPVVPLTTSQQCRDLQVDARPQDILRPEASSAHKVVVYSLLNYTQTFSIDSATGLLRINGTLQERNYNIGLRACSGINTSVCSDTVLRVRVSATDVIAFCPPFLTVNVNESVETGTFVVDLNSTKGDSNILYSLIDEDQSPFRVNRTTGVVTVQGDLDRERKDLYTLRVVAILQSSNGSATAQVTVEIGDAPDSPPEFKVQRYLGEIRESAFIGAPVQELGSQEPLSVLADDADVYPTPTLIYTVVEDTDNSNGSFIVNSTTGLITLGRGLDLENMPASLTDQYTFQVMVTDGYFNDTTVVIVNIINDNDNDPVFLPDVLNFTVNEDELFNYEVTTVHATDKDAGDTDTLVYSLLPSAEQVPFSVDPAGVLRVTGALDRETKDTYNLTVLARDKDGRNGTARIIIAIGDANELPSFQRSTYIFNVTEGPDGIGQELTITASDNDLGNNAILTFDIDSGDQSAAFNITTTSNSTAVIRVVKELNREAAPKLTLTILARDGGLPALTATCTVEVDIADVNDNSPFFNRASYKADVSEGATNNTELAISPSLEVTDRDIGWFGVLGVVYSLDNQGSPSVPFRVDSATGGLFVYLYNDTDQLDREVTPMYTLTLVATDNNGTGLNGTTTISVSLTDVNDHTPEFSQQHYDIHVTENTVVGTLVTTFNATDLDGDFGNLRFQLYPEEGGDKFYLNPVTGELRVSGLLDREIQDQYNLTLGVSDREFTGNATATITLDDMNDNCPVFNNPDPLTLTVMENQDPSIIHVFNVTDSDIGRNGNITLFMNDTVVGAYLNISASGDLRTRQKLDKEKDDQQSLTFTLWAKDAGVPPCVTSLEVKVEVQGDNEETPQVCQITPNRNKPVCGNNISITAFTGSAEGTFLAALSWVDHDEGEGGQASLSLTMDPDYLLSLNQTSSSSSSSSSSYTILTLTKTLNLDELLSSGMLGDDNATYTAEVMALDQGPQPRNSSVFLTLTVLELLPTTPVFSSAVYNFSVAENQIPSVIGSVKATTKNGNQRMNYTLVPAANFTVDDKGNISASLKLDREDKDFYTFLVLASDSPRPMDTATAVVLVRVLDENDNPPQLSSPVYDVTVAENTNDVKLMTIVATDKDAGENGRVTFTLINNTLGDVFVLNSSSGELYLNQSLDRETQYIYTLFVKAADGGTPSKTAMATVKITVQDRNDNSPKFSQKSYVGHLDENSPAGTLVQNVTATDPDSGTNGQVLYQLEPTGGVASTFYINEFNGAIYTSRSFSFDSEQRFNLSVLARDLGDPAQTSTVLVTVFVNDLSRVLPQLTFDPDIVAMVLGTPAGTLVPVNVSGGFGNFNFTIIGGNEDGLFEMDSDSGELSVTRELTQAKDYQLTIRVTNINASEYFTDGTLRVSVTSVKLEQERYAAVLKENAAPPNLLLDINSNAERSGIPVIYTLSEDQPSDAFYVTEKTGQLYCNKTLDREMKAEYILRVLVQLAHQPSSGRQKRALGATAEVVIIVDDENDNAPRFQLTSKIFGIPSSADAYTVVTTLKAEDPDAGENGALEYKATGGDTDVFHVTSEGELTSLVAMPSKGDQEFSLTVTATDQNGAGQSTRINIKIVVVPSSDRFGLVANISVTDFLEKQQFYLRNLSDILNMTLQLDKIEPHQGNVIDTSKSDIYFYAFDNNGKPIPFPQISEKAKEKADEINALFGATRVELIPVTETPVKVRIQTRYAMGEAEIAVIVVACLIFLGSFVAILLTMRAWKKQKEFAKREAAAMRARHTLEKETRDLADKIQETSFVADPDEPLELDMDPDADGQVFNPRMFLRNMRESEHRRPTRDTATEDQECVINFGNESTGLDTLALRRTVLRKTEAALLEALLEEGGEAPLDVHEADSGTDQRSGTENNDGSLSSGEHRHEGEEGEGSSAANAATAESRGSGVDAGESSTDHLLEGSVFKVLSSTAPLPVTVKAVSSSQDPLAGRSGNSTQKSSATSRDTSVLPGRKSTSANVVSPLVMLKGASMDESRTEDNDNTTETAWQRRHQAGTPPLRRNKTSPAGDDAEDNGDTRPDDPEPDYQKKVSFAGVADAKNEPDPVLDIVDGKKPEEHHPGTSTRSSGDMDFLNATAKLLANARTKQPEGFVNRAFEKEDEEEKNTEEKEKVLDGWAEDYGDRDLSTHLIVSTAL